MSEPRLRGVILLDQISYIRRQYGPAVVGAALRTLTPAARQEIEGALPISWLSVPVVTAFKTAIAAELGQNAVQFNRRLVRESIGETINAFWRVLLRQLWDSAVIKRTPILYSKTFDQGELSLRRLDGHQAEFVLVGWAEMPEFDCAGLAAGIEALLEYAGRGATTVRWRREPPRVIFEANWASSLAPPG